MNGSVWRLWQRKAERDDRHRRRWRWRRLRMWGERWRVRILYLARDRIQPAEATLVFAPIHIHTFQRRVRWVAALRFECINFPPGNLHIFSPIHSADRNHTTAHILTFLAGIYSRNNISKLKSNMHLFHCFNTHYIQRHLLYKSAIYVKFRLCRCFLWFLITAKRFEGRLKHIATFWVCVRY